MDKVMLVIDNELERKFLEKLIKRLGFRVLAIERTTRIADELLHFFPDLVFASMLGRNSKTLEALAQIKVERGKPKIIFVRAFSDTVPLSAQQRRIVDGVIYSPIDPFKLIEILSRSTGVAIEGLKERYRTLLARESGQSISHVVRDFTEQEKDEKLGSSGSQLIRDSQRQKRYDNIVTSLKDKNREYIKDFDVDRFKELTRVEPEFLQKENPQQKVLKKNFISKLFTAPIKTRKS